MKYFVGDELRTIVHSEASTNAQEKNCQSERNESGRWRTVLLVCDSENADQQEESTEEL